MKRFFLILLFLIALLTGAIFFIALPQAEKSVTNHLANLGYPQSQIKQSKINLWGLSFSLINLDADGFNQIKNLKINIYWPTYLINRTIDKIEIETLNLYALDKDISKAIRNFIRKDAFFNLPASTLKIHNIEINLTISDTSVIMSGNMQATLQGQKQYLNGHLSSNQYNLGFSSQWSGFIDPLNKDLEVDGNFENIKLKTKQLSINRGFGWLSYHAARSDNILGAQFQAGSGEIFNVPTNDIALTIGQNQDHYPMLLRAKASGIENVYFTADYNYHNLVENRDFQSTLDIPDLKSFLEHLESLNIINNNYILETKSPLNLLIQYEKDKKFPSGPLPFKLSVNKDTNGTVLLYPDSYDVRGTLELDQTTMSVFQSIFDIRKDLINNNLIRIDGNARSILK